MAGAITGQIWRGLFQFSLETTAGTSVPATRRGYFNAEASKLTRERDVRFHKFATASRDNTRAATRGPVTVAGTLEQPLSSSEIIELLLMGVKAAVTPTGTTAKLWTFTPGTTLAPATIEWHDGARVWEASGCYVESLKIAGSVKDTNTVTAEIFGLSMVSSSLTGALAERVPDFIEGWETKLYVDTFGGTAGTTVVEGTLLNWEIEIKNNLMRKYFADNTLDAGAIRPGELEISAKLTFDAAATAALTAFNDFDAATKKLVRLEFGQNEVIDGSDKKFVTVDLPAAWSAVDLGASDDGSRAYALSCNYVYDPTNGFGLQIRAQNARATAW